MTKTPPAPPVVVRFDDHEVITPPNPLEAAVSIAPAGDDPVARAEAALAQLATEFSHWMDAECERLEQARLRVHAHGLSAPQREALFRAAHDIKGQAATLGFPLAASAAESLCRLIEHSAEPEHLPLALIDQHVHAVRAIIREHDRPLAEALAEQLTRRLRAVTDDFLRRHGKDLENMTLSPPIAPGER
jgi:chemotaxis protein histidine kinase CheA